MCLVDVARRVESMLSPYICSLHAFTDARHPANTTQTKYTHITLGAACEEAMTDAPHPIVPFKYLRTVKLKIRNEIYLGRSNI